MFDIGFWELTIIAIIALLVIGPDRLPTFARTAGLWLRKARQLLSGIKNDIDRELRTEELKRIMKSQEISEIHEIIEETQTTVTDTAKQLSSMDALTNGAKPSSNTSGDESVSANTENPLSSPSLGNTPTMADSASRDDIDTPATYDGKESTNH
uniref:Sec-independent protein translocase protein TatB n=1 Tax=Candidatus Kentrum sp. FW TaxID=2126338 RepID=A0A450SB49_9GAMM|nr:MAG: sec-independent protein translocase protein TatB [Candidatus Kentron sp. FW]VFJ56148.1 MAG: sec-independent protein translocase protein TatB [Candidatus Kentron sp. FW]